MLILSLILIPVAVISLRIYDEYLKISTITAEFSASMNIIFVDSENISMAISSRYQELTNSGCPPSELGSDFLVKNKEKNRSYRCMLSALGFINKKISESDQLELDPSKLYFYSPELGLLYFFSKNRNIYFNIQELELLRDEGIYKKSNPDYYQRLLSTDERSDGNSSTGIYIDRITNQQAYTLTSFVYGNTKEHPVGFLYYDHTKKDLHELFMRKINHKSRGWISAYIINSNNKDEICITDICHKGYLKMTEDYSDQYSVAVYLDILKFIKNKFNILIVLMLTIFIIVSFVITTLKSASGHLKSMLDPLTGAYTRKSIKYIDISYSSYFILFDLNKFKAINDTYGHLAGDKALLKISNLIKENIRETDIVIRLGGDEFLVHIKNADCSLALKIANRISDDVVMSGFEFNGVKIPLSVSFGVSEFKGTIDESIKSADEEMYNQKNAQE